MPNYVVCEICGDVLEQITGSHLERHNITLDEYRKLYPFSETLSESTQQKLLELDHIRCKICGQFLKEISTHHLRKHNMTLAEYRTQFPDEPTISQATITKRTVASREHSQRMTGENNPFYGKKHDSETRKIMSIKSKTAWEQDGERLRTIHKEAGQRRRGENHPRWKGGYDRGALYEAGLGGGDAKFKARRRALRVHGHKCMIPGCEFDFFVHNHHITPRGEGGSHSLDNCILLCPNHHALADAGILTREYLYSIVQSSLNEDN